MGFDRFLSLPIFTLHVGLGNSRRIWVVSEDFGGFGSLHSASH